MCFAISFIPIGIIGGIQGFKSDTAFLISLIFIVTFVVSYLLSFFITRPLEKLTKNIDSISKGKLDVHLGYTEIHEINNLTDSLNRVMASLKLAVLKVGVKKGEIFEDAVKAKEFFEQKQQDLLNSIYGWAWETDKNNVYTFCSENVSDILGYNAEEIVGQSIFEFMDTVDSKNAKKAFNDASKKKTPLKNLENWNITKNGGKICVMTNAVPYYNDQGVVDGFRGVDTDITSEKQSQFRIKELKKELSSIKGEINNLLNERDSKKSKLLDTGSSEFQTFDEKWSEHDIDAICVFDENANILDCNENMQKSLGYNKSELLSLNMADIDALESKKDIVNKIKKVKKDGSISFKTIHKRKDGSAVLVHENLQYNKNKNTIKAIVREDYTKK